MRPAGLGFAAAALLLTACHRDAGEQSTQTRVVFAKAETEPVGTAEEDAADDPAIWRNAGDPAASLIVATDKKAGLYVYGLDGRPRSFTRAGRLNNVDLVENGGEVIVAASDRNDVAQAKLQLYRLDQASGKLTSLGFVDGGKGEAYGVCLWRDGQALNAFSVLKSGLIEQVQIDFDAAGAPSGRIVRSLHLKSQGEGCVVDPRTRQLYVGEEDRGIWRFDASPNAATAGTLVARADNQQLKADVEGLALVPGGTDGGYLVASSQGDNAFAVYSLPAMKAIGRFRIGSGKVGSVEETDGIAVALGGFGANYPDGLMVAQDGDNAPRAQNFKLVSWADVGRALNLQTTK